MFSMLFAVPASRILERCSSDQVKANQMTNEDFLISTYCTMLETAMSSGYEFCAYDQIGKESGDRSCILRHDIDSELLGCGQMLDAEKKLGVHATYFVMTRSTAYNSFCVEGRRMIERILGEGHQIGLHFMGELCEENDEQNISEKVTKEVKWLEEEFQASINAVSFHQPSKVVLESNIEIPRLINTYNKNQMQDYFYVSDTNMNWRHEHPVEIFSKSLYPKLQLLIHPMWWTVEPMSLEGKWRYVLECNRSMLVSHWKERERTLRSVDISQRL